MSNNNIYPITLLNDLHNWFPDVLYNPGRFRNVQDLLDYIRQGADVNPYTRGLQYYQARHNTQARYPPVGPVGPVPVAAPQRQAYPPQPIRRETAYEYQNNIPITARIRTIPLNVTTQDNPILTTMLDGFTDTAVTNMLNQFLHPNVLQNFLNQTVTVHPTNEEIDNATTVYTESAESDDNCAICQDPFEQGQELRRIDHCNHKFHKDCIDVWFSRNVNCPTCRHDIRENSEPANVANNPPPVPENHRRTDIHRND